MKIRFKPDNDLVYMQDMSFMIGVPSDIDFTVDEVTETKAVLSAPGYGGLPYGNGKLRVYRPGYVPPLIEHFLHQRKVR